MANDVAERILEILQVKEGQDLSRKSGGEFDAWMRVLALWLLCDEDIDLTKT
jgi:hypothetical protein